MSFEFAIQKALFAALNAENISTFDFAPQAEDGGDDRPFPYVEIGMIEIAPWDDKNVNGFEYRLRIHSYDRSGSSKATKDLQGVMFERLHNGEIEIEGFTSVLLRRTRSDVVRNQKDGSFHGVCEYNGLAETAATEED